MPGPPLEMTRTTAIQGDITAFDGDAIVNAANSRLAGGGGVDGAIHRAGGPSILEECRIWVEANGHLPTGEAIVTGAGDLPVRHVIHTVGPIWANHSEAAACRLLASCYRHSLDLAVSHDCRSIAFPNISTGIYGFPKDLAAATAVDAVARWVEESDRSLQDVVFVCFNEENREIYSRLLDS